MSGCNCVIEMNDGTIHEGEIGQYSCHLAMAEALSIDFNEIKECGWKKADGTIEWGLGNSIKEK